MTDLLFTAFPFKATGGLVPRSMPDRLADVVNVRDYGAVGDGSTDDSSAVQAAIDAAFGPSNAPHGTSATQNRPLIFPNGNYRVDTRPTLTQVRGGLIVGAGQLTTTISGASGAFLTEGLEYCNFENLSFHSGSGSGKVAFDLDWSGSGSIGLKGNIFTNCAFDGGDHAFKIGTSGNGGSNNQFYSCNWTNSAVAGMVAWGSAATGNSVQGGGASSNGTAFWCKDGQICSINDVGLSGNTTQDFLTDSAYPVLIKGTRTESALMGKQTNVNSVVVLDGVSAAASVSEYFHPKGRVIIDSCTSDPAANSGTGVKLCTDAAYTGTVYIRGCSFRGTASSAPPWTHFLSGFAGDASLQNI